MDINTPKQEQASFLFNKEIGKVFNLQSFDISYAFINISEKNIKAVSTNYLWHLRYWENDFDMRLNQRLSTGIREWSTYDNSYRNLLKNYNPGKMYKLDITTETEDGYEIISINSSSDSTNNNVLVNCGNTNFFREKAKNTFLKLGDEISLPLRFNHKCSKKEPPITFNLTEMEIDTIVNLTKLKSVKEIALLHQCSESSERKRIEKIRRKLDCTGFPLSKIYEKFKVLNHFEN